MENNHDSRKDKEHQGGINLTNSNKDLPLEKTTAHPDGLLPQDDPALINPDELATFPKEVKNDDPDIESERESHSVNLKSSPVRDGRNITNTGPNPDKDGFM